MRPVAALILAALPVAAIAHHGWSSYDASKTIKVTAPLANVQWVYLSIAVFVLILACLFYVSKIPEITDAGTLNPLHRHYHY